MLCLIVIISPQPTRTELLVLPLGEYLFATPVSQFISTYFSLCWKQLQNFLVRNNNAMVMTLIVIIFQFLIPT
jgi:hypothetical protein